MVIASLNSENISVFAFLYNREKFSAQVKGLFLRNNLKCSEKKDTNLRPYSLLLLSNEKLNNGIHGINALEL